MKVAIVYRSRTGTTRALAGEMARVLEESGAEVRLLSTAEARPADVADADRVLLGCWTGGLMVVLQHPDREWVGFVRRLPPLAAAKVGLFTTYALATGGMFRRMRRHLPAGTPVTLELRSRNGRLTEAQRAELRAFLGG